MSTTHRIPVTDDEYTNVSNGNLNCTLVVETGVRLRIVVGGEEPDPDTSDYIPISGPGSSATRASILTVTNLKDETDLWVCAEVPDSIAIMVVRGPATLMIASGD